jgi:hypothetical protein
MNPNLRHSDSFRRRLYNTDHNTKSEEDHIAHFKTKLKERFNIEITTDQYYEILKFVVANLKYNLVYKLNTNSSVNETIINDQRVWVIYGRPDNAKRLTDVELHARLKTVLIPNTVYVVPPKLARKYDHTSFTVKLNQTIELVKKVSNQINMRKQNPYKVLTQLPEILRPLAKQYKKDNVVTNHWIHTIVSHLGG